jgi:hypothetical protein
MGKSSPMGYRLECYIRKQDGLTSHTEGVTRTESGVQLSF